MNNLYKILIENTYNCYESYVIANNIQEAITKFHKDSNEPLVNIKEIALNISNILI